MSTPDFEAAIAEIRTRDPRYAREVYIFVFESLAYTQRALGRSHHVTGQELLDGIRALAQEQFGYLARTVFNEWGVHTTGDFGRLVFNLVQANLMGKQDSDTPEDFENHYDFAEAFERDWRPDTVARVTANAPEGFDEGAFGDPGGPPDAGHGDDHGDDVDISEDDAL